jgi:hypothetical protein
MKLKEQEQPQQAVSQIVNEKEDENNICLWTIWPK